MSDSPPASITALPDVQSTPSETKRAKFENLHDDSTHHFDPEASGSASGDYVQVAELATPVVNAIPLPGVEAEENEVWYDITMTWDGRVFPLRVGGNDMVYDFRTRIHELTGVPSDRQKLIGLTKGKLSAEADPTRFSTIGVKDGCKFKLIGTSEELSFKDPGAVIMPDIYDDFDVEYSTLQRQKDSDRSKPLVLPANDPRNKRKIAEKVQACPITIMNEPRPGKRLLVLDLDYTLVDTRPMIDGALPVAECARPGLHQFLEAVYPHYDIVIWSQTHWRWLETKLVELGMIGGTANYKICFVADRTSMFPVFTQRNGRPYKHEVKPLAYFWASFPQWSAANTVHIDDLSRNFALNPEEGVKIRGFNGAGTIEGFADRELDRLTIYLENLARNCNDFRTVNHASWKKGIILPDTNSARPAPLVNDADRTGAGVAATVSPANESANMTDGRNIESPASPSPNPPSDSPRPPDPPAST